MPKNKDLKRLIRARMEKTGESYTAARAHIVGDAGDSRHRPLPENHEALAGMSDDAVRKATGRSWPEWAALLDEAGAHTWTHKVIAAHVHGSFDVGGWWSQMITVGYERLRGLRDVGQRRGGGYDVNKSKTVLVPVEALWGAFADAAGRAAWLDDDRLSFHRLTPTRSMRGKWADETPVAVYFTAKGPAKSTVSIQLRGLPDPRTAQALKTAWGARLERLAAVLSA